MTGKNEPEVRERRADDRLPLAESVSIRIPESQVVGPSGNLSKTGIYFLANAEFRVEVILPGHEEPISGRIVRLGTVREGELGIAVAFDEPYEND